jgi:hypothetical protein
MLLGYKYSYLKLNTMFSKILTEIAKLLVLPTLRRNMKEAEKKMGEDQELQTYIESARYHLDLADKKMESLCKRHPESRVCKKYFEKIKSQKQ